MLLLLLLLAGVSAAEAQSNEVLVPAGTYVPFFRDQGEKDESIGKLWVDKHPVTNQQYLTFVREHPEWKRSNAKRIFAGTGYLEHWTGDDSFAKGLTHQPVTNVSWFAARKYCEAQGKRLLRTAEWEYVSDAQNPVNLQIILDWYGRPEGSPAARVSNGFGLIAMHGQIWEWVEDFSSAIVNGDSRSGGEMSKSMFCGAGAMKAKDPTQYATFMRIAHRSSLRASSVGRQLGFRCARSLNSEEIP